MEASEAELASRVRVSPVEEEEEEDQYGGGDGTYHMLAIKPRGLSHRDEELRAVAVRSRVGHGEQPGLRVLDGSVLIGELTAVDRLATLRSRFGVETGESMRGQESGPKATMGKEEREETEEEEEEEEEANGRGRTVPSPLVKSPPCSMNPGMMRCIGLPA